MDGGPLSILLVEDNPGDARLLREALADATLAPFVLAQVERLGDAPRRLNETRFDVILLDLSLQDGQGLDAVTKLHAQAPDVPVVVLTGAGEDLLGVTAVQAGAQDYLSKGQMSGNALVCSMRYAVERHRLQEELRGMSLVDELTHLHSRRGFLMLVEQQLKMADRTGCGLLLILATLDNLLEIKASRGRQESDRARIDAAEILKDAFRGADIVGRAGEDAFAVAAIETGRVFADLLIARLHQKITTHNATAGRDYVLDLSAGAAYYDPEYPCTIEELLAQADAAAYEQRQARSRLDDVA